MAVGQPAAGAMSEHSGRVAPSTVHTGSAGGVRRAARVSIRARGCVCRPGVCHELVVAVAGCGAHRDDHRLRARHARRLFQARRWDVAVVRVARAGPDDLVAALNWLTEAARDVQRTN